MGGISRGLHNAGYDMLVVEIDPRDTGWARKLLDSAQVDGFVLMTSTRKQAHIKLLSELQAPFVAWGVPGVEAGFCTVSSDNRRGGELAGRHLVGLGRRRIALIAGPEIEAEVQLRLSGCANALAAAGLSLDDGLVRWGDFSEESGRQAMESLLDLDPRPDAVFAFGDFMAIGAMKAIRGRGLRIPEDVAVVGFDNLMVAAYVEPPLTTVSQNVARSGKALAESLVQYLRTGQISHVIMPVDLVRRGSA